MRLNIHGDNVVECERTLSLIAHALGADVLNAHGPFDSAACPLFQVRVAPDGPALNVRYFPGFGRWPQDILTWIRAKGGVLREAADAIITNVRDTFEEPLIAIEYCGALPAGNQAWQRNGRAYSFARAGIPYVYIAEVGGYELDATRTRRSARLPNPAAPFSYLSLSASTDTLVTQVILPSPGADTGTMQLYKDIYGHDTLLSLISHVILGQPYEQDEHTLKEKLLHFITLLATGRKRKDSMPPAQWRDAYQFISDGGTLADYVLQKAPLSWQKMAYIQALTNTARRLMDSASKYAIGLTSSNLPVCLIPPSSIAPFAAEMLKLYPDLPKPFAEWLHNRSKLTICWVMGFKPQGDDARPDRGLSPMARMLIGDHNDLLTIVYGPAPTPTWTLLENDPAGLMRSNGLWEAVLATSDALLVDSATATTLNRRAFLKSHWQETTVRQKAGPLLVPPVPVRIGEHDVDTVLHQLFSRLLPDQAFEGMCNPPGGDWSGVSLLTSDKSSELRWLSLPRVTQDVAKRPDHLFEIFGLYKAPLILVVESKERSEQVETSIGPRLIRYITDLISTIPSIRKEIRAGHWHYATESLSVNPEQLVSAVAFVGGPKVDLQKIARSASADIVFSLEFADGGKNCVVHAYAQSQTGQKVIDLLHQSLPTKGAITLHEP